MSYDSLEYIDEKTAIVKQPIDHLKTPLGTFQVLRNGRSIPFQYVRTMDVIKGFEMEIHSVDIDTSLMRKGDHIQTGIPEATFLALNSDEQCIFNYAENDEWYLVLNSEEILPCDAAEEYTFITDDFDQHGWEYLIHQEPSDFIHKPNRACRIISLRLTWGRKDFCEDYREIIEEAAW